MHVNIAMRQHHAFGSGAGTARVKNLGDGIFVNIHDVRAKRRSGRKKFVVVSWREPICLRHAIEKIESLDGRNRFAKGLDGGEKILLEKKKFCPRIVQNKSELMWR